MSAERPEAGVPEQPSPDGLLPPEPEVVAPADADDFKGKDGKYDAYFSPEPGEGD